MDYNYYLSLESEVYDYISDENISLEAPREYVEYSLYDFKPLTGIKGYNFQSRYMCNKEGIIVSVDTIEKGVIKGYLIRPYVNRDHYVEYVIMETNGKMRHINAHRIVASLFLKPKAGKTDVNHKDGNRQNNHVDNLEWVSRSENIRHSYDKLRSNPDRLKFDRRLPGYKKI